MPQIFFDQQPLGYDNSAPMAVKNFQEGTIEVNASKLLGRPDVLQNIFPHLMEDMDFVDFFIQSGRTEKTAQTNFHHFEEKPLVPLAQIKSSSGTPGAGNALTIVIEAINTDKIIPFKKWDVWEVGGIYGWIEADDDITANTSTGEHSVVFKPTIAAENIVAAAVDGDFITWRGAAKADGTKMPDGMMNEPVQFTGNCQIIPTTFISDGSAAANMTQLPITKSGAQYGYIRGVDQAYTRQKMAIALALGLGKGTTTLVDADNSSKAVNLTKGFDWQIRDGGLNEPGAVFDYDELLKIHRALDKNNAPKEYISPSGNEAYYQAMQIFFDKGVTPTFGAFAGNDYTKYGAADPQKRALDLGFNSVHFFSRTYHFKQEKFLNYKQITGAPGQIYPWTLYFLPMTKANLKGEDGKITLTDVCRVRYKASDRENRFMMSWTQDRTVNDKGEDKFYFFHMSDIGWQQAMRHWAARWYKDDTATS